MKVGLHSNNSKNEERIEIEKERCNKETNVLKIMEEKGKGRRRERERENGKRKRKERKNDKMGVRE